MHKYYLEFILHAYDLTAEVLEKRLREFGEDLEIFELSADNPEKGKNFRIHIRSDTPTIIFDACAQFGRLKSVKIDEERR